MTKLESVAVYFLSLSEPEAGDFISNLKLQKLVYYAQGFHLAMYDAPLFEDEIKAWEHGPVVPSLYHKYKEHGSKAIDISEKISFTQLAKEEKELVGEVYKVYGQFSAWKLRNLTHGEAPWKDTGKNEVISHELMKRFFKTLLVEDGQ